ncbi:hypothetical protein GYMLUDRAFT_935468 [Collybiopsis luxurians FD-317 M1]|nr:hypothetical protein GYMLUDRAFT_935468 [Collybiopsis luxurians FD-317 M1]
MRTEMWGQCWGRRLRGRRRRSNECVGQLFSPQRSRIGSSSGIGRIRCRQRPGIQHQTSLNNNALPTHVPPSVPPLLCQNCIRFFTHTELLPTLHEGLINIPTVKNVIYTREIRVSDRRARSRCFR